MNSVPSFASLSGPNGLDASHSVSSGATQGVLGRCRCRAADLEPAARLADEQHRRAQAAHLVQALAQLLHDPRLAQLRHREAGARQDAPAGERLADRREQLRQADRLLEEIEGADARGLDRGVDRAVARHHHHRHREQPRSRPLLEERDAVRVRHPDVEQDEVGAHLLAQGARGLGVFGQAHAVALVAQDLEQQLADADFVIHDHDLVGRHRRVWPQAASRRGRTMLTCAPWGFTFSTTMWPWCSSTIFFTIARPESGALGLGGDVGLEDAADDRVRDSGAVVAHGEQSCPRRRALDDHDDARLLRRRRARRSRSG